MATVDQCSLRVHQVRAPKRPRGESYNDNSALAMSQASKMKKNNYSDILLVNLLYSADKGNYAVAFEGNTKVT